MTPFVELVRVPISFTDYRVKILFKRCLLLLLLLFFIVLLLFLHKHNNLPRVD